MEVKKGKGAFLKQLLKNVFHSSEYSHNNKLGRTLWKGLCSWKALYKYFIDWLIFYFLLEVYFYTGIRSDKEAFSQKTYTNDDGEVYEIEPEKWYMGGPSFTNWHGFPFCVIADTHKLVLFEDVCLFKKKPLCFAAASA